MGMDKYENPAGFDACVDDAALVADCLDEAAAKHHSSPWIPEGCSAMDGEPY
jgi:hypothetical protein